MIIAVTAPTGQVGSKVASYLLNMKGVQVNLTHPRPPEGRGVRETSARVVSEGDLQDTRVS